MLRRSRHIYAQDAATHNMTMCITKIAYPTHRAALRAGISMKKRLGTKVAYYYCPRCSRYHLTSQLWD